MLKKLKFAGTWLRNFVNDFLSITDVIVIAIIISLVYINQ